FSGENVVSSDALQELATGLRENELRIDWAVETILRSDLFFSNDNIKSRVVDPVCYLIGPLRACECFHNPPSTLALADTLRRMGLDLFTPPNVGGWSGGRTWLSTRTVIARANAIADFFQGRFHLPVIPFDLAALVARHVDCDDITAAIRFLGMLFWGGIEQSLVDSIAESLEKTADRSNQLRQIVIRLLTQPQAYLH
ncbi:MAG: DUF1800 domain-containing protein, partial [Planctomycetes bacterium]|nr:DUF1800 domain-containing protein [Planctomycetota bacterium]